MTGTNAQDATAILSRRLPHLRPSEQNDLASRLETEDQMQAFGHAIGLALKDIVSGKDETTERVYLLGLEMRRVFDDRKTPALPMAAHWSEIDSTVVEAFAGGFRREQFEEVFLRIKTDGAAAPAERVSCDFEARTEDGVTAATFVTRDAETALETINGQGPAAGMPSL